MDDSRFWETIQQTRGDDGDADHSGRLAARLVELGPEEIIDFQLKFDRYHDAAYKDDLWMAAILLNGGNCADDCFKYFRCWLISRGRLVYERALIDPDSLADEVTACDDCPPYIQFEDYCYAAFDAYETAASRDLLSALDEIGPQGSEDQGGPFDWERYTDEFLATRFPRLWSKYGHLKQRHDERIRELSEDTGQRRAVAVQGLGTVQVGTIVRHQNLGQGVVKALFNGTTVTALIEFDDDTRPMMLSEAWFSIVEQ